MKRISKIYKKLINSTIIILTKITTGSKMYSNPHPKPDPIKPGEESVWNYPRPPRIERIEDEIQVVFNGEVVADSKGGYRILETSHPPTYYIDPSGVKSEYFREAGGGSSYCEWKGSATYYDIVVGDKVAPRVAWGYKEPTGMYKDIKGHIAVYAGKVDYCTVDGEKVIPQPGDFYGGWITKNIKGPFKGIPGSWGW